MKLGILLIFLGFLTYLTTISPTIALRDSPELVACAYNLTVAHAPGHSLYLLLGKLFSFIPFGSLAWRLNLLSAIFASLNIIIFYLILVKIWALITRKGQNPGLEDSFNYPRVNDIGAFSAGLILAFSQTFWAYALGAETYSLNTFLLALITLALLQEGEPRFLFFAAFVAGLLIASHTVNIIYFAGFVFLGTSLFLKYFKVWRIKEWPLSVLFAGLGASILLYLPLRNITPHGIYFGVVKNWKEFIQLISGKIYFSDFPAFSIPFMVRLYNLNYALLSPGREFGLLFCLTGLIGLIYLVKKSPVLTLSFFILIISNVLFFANSDLGYPDVNAFPSQLFSFSYFIFALFIGLGLLIVLRQIRYPARQISIIILILLSPLYLIHKNYRINNYSNNYEFYNLGKEMLQPLERSSIFICNNVNSVLFLFSYFTGIEDKWKDVDPLFSMPIFKGKLEIFLKIQGGNDGAKDLPQMGIHSLIASNLGKRPIYTSGPGKDIEGYRQIKKGILYKITGIKDIIAHNPRIENITEIKYGHEIVLLGYNMDKESLVVGDNLDITYFWQAQRKMAEDHEIAVLLTNEKGELILRNWFDGLSFLPAYGVYSTKKWGIGEIIQETHGVFIPLNYQPGRYFINVAVGDKEGLLEIRESKVPVEGRFARIAGFQVKAKEKNKAGSSSNVQR